MLNTTPGEEDKMPYKRSEERYAGGGQVKYLVYKSPQPLRTGRIQERARVQRLYFPADARDISLDQAGTLVRRTGRKVHGVAVHYRYQLASARARRGNTFYQMPERWADRTKIVELPGKAKDVRLTDRPPVGPKMAIA
jgi:hypothetical protein